MAPPLRKVLSYSELSRYRTLREKSLDESSPSPTTAGGSSNNNLNTPTAAPPSPPRLLRKKTSRVALAQPPKLEPAFRSSTTLFTDGSGRRSLRRRSPSPPSPRNSNTNNNNNNASTGSSRKDGRRPSLGFPLRSKSSDGMLNQFSSSSASVPPLPSVPANQASPSPFGSLTASTESVCRTLRAYRKKLSIAATTTSTTSSSSSSNNANSNTNNNSSTSSTSGPGSGSGAGTNHFALDSLSPDALRELEKELKLTARVVGEKFLLATGNKAQVLDEKSMTKLLDRASERIVGLLDQRIKERLDCGDREDEDREVDDSGGDGNGDGDANGGGLSGGGELIGRDEKVRVLAGALAEVRLGR